MLAMLAIFVHAACAEKLATELAVEGIWDAMGIAPLLACIFHVKLVLFYRFFYLLMEIRLYFFNPIKFHLLWSLLLMIF